MAIDRYSNRVGGSEKDEEERQKRKREAEERAAKIRKLQAEIKNLERSKADYVKLLDDVSNLSDKLGSLGSNLNNSADSIVKGLTLDGIPIGEQSLRTTSQKVSNYATNLSSTESSIIAKIKDLELRIQERRTRLRALVY